MFTIQGISLDPQQTQNVVLADGSVMGLTLSYSAAQYSWFMDITYGSFSLTSFRVCTSPNLLYQYLNQIPFGIACFTTDLYDPTQQQDFNSGYATLYLLTGAEVAQYQEIVSGV